MLADEKQFGSGRHGKYMSLIRQGDRILALDQGGGLHLIKADPEKFQLIDTKKSFHTADLVSHRRK